MAVRVIDHIVEIGNVLFLNEIAQDIDVAVRFRVGGKNVVVGDDHDFVPVPDFGGLAKLAFEHANGARAANVVGHQHIGVDPYIIAGLHPGLAAARARIFSVNVIIVNSHRVSREFQPWTVANQVEASINTGLYGSIQLHFRGDIDPQKKARRGTQQIRAQVF